MTDRPGRALGLDLGTVRIGVAVSDDARTVATPLEVIDRKDRQNADRQLASLIDEWEIAVVVAGLPLHLNGSRGATVGFVEKEIRRLGATLPVPIVTYDERLTSVTAHRSLSEQNLSARAQRNVVDMVAAAVILQGWMESTHDD